MKKNVINVMLGLFVAMVFGLTGCGGSGGSSAGGGAGTTDTVSGIAASGAVIAGSVYLKDSASTPKELSKVIATDGSYSFDVAGMTKPYLLKAVGTANGTNYTLYSFATDKGTANINPLSNLIVHNAAGVSDVGSVYSSPQLTTMQTIAGKIPQATTDVKTSIMPLLTAYGVSTVNPITDTYKADHSGLDGMFDNVTVSVTSGTATIKNTSTGTTIFTSPVTSITTGTVTSGNIPQPSTYTITGAVTNSGAGLSGVTITLSGSSTNTATTDSSGNYSFSAQNGSYTITSSKSGYTFSPTSLSATVSSANISGKNFTASVATYTPTYSISGTVKTNGIALTGVTVSTSGGSATTDAVGNYTISGLSNGLYTITPNHIGLNFIPYSRGVLINNGSKTGMDFIANNSSELCNVLDAGITSSSLPVKQIEAINNELQGAFFWYKHSPVASNLRRVVFGSIDVNFITIERRFNTMTLTFESNALIKLSSVTSCTSDAISPGPECNTEDIESTHHLYCMVEESALATNGLELSCFDGIKRFTYMCENGNTVLTYNSLTSSTGYFKKPGYVIPN